jgi:hypothetical protein
MNEKIDPYVSGKTDDNGQKDHQGPNNGRKRSFQGTANKQIGDDKGGHRERNPYSIANIHGPIKKGRFDFIFGIAMGTSFVHFEKIP